MGEHIIAHKRKEGERVYCRGILFKRDLECVKFANANIESLTVIRLCSETKYPFVK